MYYTIVFFIIIVENRENLANIHDEELLELRLFFEDKMQKTEQAYIEEITTIKEQHEMDMGKKHQGLSFFMIVRIVSYFLSFCITTLHLFYRVKYRHHKITLTL